MVGIGMVGIGMVGVWMVGRDGGSVNVMDGGKATVTYRYLPGFLASA